MSVQDEITRIAAGKEDLLNAIAEQGIEVADDTPIEQTGAKVRAIGDKFYTKTESDNKYATQAAVDKAVKYGDILQPTNQFGGKKLYISKIDNAFYAADKRYTVTASQYSQTDNSLVSEYDSRFVARLFNGYYDDWNCVIEAGNYAVIKIQGSPYIGVMLYGDIIINFYNFHAPKNVSIRVYCDYEPSGIGWKNLNVNEVYSNNKKCAVNAYNSFFNIAEIEITITANAETKTSLSEIEMRLNSPEVSDSPVVSKYAAEKLYYPLTAPEFKGKLTGTADKATSDQNGNNIASTYQKKNELATAILPLVYPVGSIYMSDSESNNPQNWANAPSWTWERIENKYLVAEGDDFTVTNGNHTGGSNSVTLAEENLPKHRHTMGHTHEVTVDSMQNSGYTTESHIGFRTVANDEELVMGADGFATEENYWDIAASAGSALAKHLTATTKGRGFKLNIDHTHTAKTGSPNVPVTGDKGDGTAFDVKPSYYVVYVWKRTA